MFHNFDALIHLPLFCYFSFDPLLRNLFFIIFLILDAGGVAPYLQRQITSTGTSVTRALSETHAPSPKLPSQACHRGGRVGPRPPPEVHAERHQRVSLTHTTRHDLRVLTLQISLTVRHDLRF